jgi:hypothetical protein
MGDVPIRGDNRLIGLTAQNLMAESFFSTNGSAIFAESAGSVGFS